MKSAWLEVPERSNRFWLNTITWIALRLGRVVADALLYPITGYFLLFSDRTRQESRRFLERVLGRTCGWPDLFRHYHVFARTLLDRIYTFAGEDDRLTIEAHGLEVLERQARSGRGALLVGAHLGSFEIVRALGRMRHGFRVKALMHGESTPRITALFRRLNPALFEDLVYMGRPDSLVGLEAHTREGGLVAILGDRAPPGSKRVACDFLGEPAWFPEAPVTLARILDVPMILFVCLNRGNGRYEIWFEALADSKQLNGKRRSEAVQSIMQRYANRIEHYCCVDPYNWFNFYDFWANDD